MTAKSVASIIKLWEGITMNRKCLKVGWCVFAVFAWAFNIFTGYHLIGDAIKAHKYTPPSKQGAQLAATEPKSCYKVVRYADEGNGLHSEAVRVDMRVFENGRFWESISLLIPEKQMVSTGWSRLKEGDMVYFDYHEDKVLKGRSDLSEFSYLEPRRLAL